MDRGYPGLEPTSLRVDAFASSAMVGLASVIQQEGYRSYRKRGFESLQTPW